MRRYDRGREEHERGPALVLAIDDEPAILASLRRILRGLPIRLQCVATAEEALEAIHAEVPTAIVSDHQLPGMPGLELLQQVRARWPWIRTLLFTGDPEVHWRAGQLPFPVLEKGSSPEAVRAAVAGLLTGCVPMR